MVIGIIPKRGEAFEENKWYIGVEIWKCSSTKVGVFQPFFWFFFMKVTDIGESTKIGGRPMKQIGGYKHWEFPIGLIIRFEIRK